MSDDAANATDRTPDEAVRISTLDLRGHHLSPAELRSRLPRAEFDVEAAVATVRPILADVQAEGGAALRRYSEQFDGVAPAAIRVGPEALRTALAQLDPAIRSALEESIARVRAVDADQVRPDDSTRVVEGGTVTQRWVPVQRVGLYVPGGRAVLASSVVMNVVPAQAAGVRELAVASPPQKDFGGLPHPTILAACELLGVSEVYAVGGAQAIAMFAYGASGLEKQGDAPAACDPVDVITGPGNIYVTAAKRAVLGQVGTDGEAGPTEIAILADATANPAYVAADLISQAEHDPMAASVLVTDSGALESAVREELDAQVPTARHKDRIRTALAGEQSGIVLVDDLEQGLDVVNAYGAEHLEIQTADAAEVAARVTNAGAVFVGAHAPVSLGDYDAGSNHVLPTAGNSRFGGGLSVQTFLRGIHVIDYDEAALAASRTAVETLAEAEDLPSHGRAVTIRFER